MILTGILIARNVHLACFRIRYLAGVRETARLETRLAGHMTGQDCRKSVKDHSTISLPRSMPIWHWKPYSPGLSGVNSTLTSSPSGNLAL